MVNKALELLSSLGMDEKRNGVSIDTKDIMDLFDLSREVETKAWQCGTGSAVQYLQYVSDEIDKLAVEIGSKPVVLLYITVNNELTQRDFLQFIESVEERTTHLIWGLGLVDEGEKCSISALVQPAFEADTTLDDNFKWCENAAYGGDDAAQCSLGEMYYHGSHIEQNFSKAFKWSLSAAEQGNADAQYNVGVMYYNGEGIGQDIAEAHKWFVKANENGRIAAEYITDCKTKLSILN